MILSAIILLSKNLIVNIEIIFNFLSYLKGLTGEETVIGNYVHINLDEFLEKLLSKFRKKLPIVSVLTLCIDLKQSKISTFQNLISEALKSRFVVKLENEVYMYFPKRLLSLQLAKESINK